MRLSLRNVGWGVTIRTVLFGAISIAGGTAVVAESDDPVAGLRALTEAMKHVTLQASIRQTDRRKMPAKDASGMPISPVSSLFDVRFQRDGDRAIWSTKELMDGHFEGIQLDFIWQHGELLHVQAAIDRSFA